MILGLNNISNQNKELQKSSITIKATSKNTTYSSSPINLSKQNRLEQSSQRPSNLQLSLGETKQIANQSINSNTSFDKAHSSSRQQEFSEANSQNFPNSSHSNVTTPNSIQLTPMPLPEVVDSTPKTPNAEDKPKSRSSSDEE